MTTEQIVTLTKKLLTIPSTKDRLDMLEKALDVVKGELQGYFPIEEFESNGLKSLIIHNTQERTKQFKIILNAHVDVVPGTKEQFIPFEKNGRLYGRGTYDMKAALAIMVLTFKEVAKKVSYPIALQVVSDEESMSFEGTRHHIAKGIRGDFVISGECGSSMEIVNKAKGLFWFKLKTKGKHAHGAKPWEGENALWKLLEALQILKQKYPIPQEAVWQTTMNLAKIETNNSVFNIVPNEAVAYIDIRFIPEDYKTILQDVTSLLPDDVTIEVETIDPPMFAEDTNPYVKALLQEIKTVTGKDGKTKVAHATSDIRFYDEVGCKGVEFGVVGAHQHGDNEWIEIAKLKEYADVLSRFLLHVSQEKI